MTNYPHWKDLKLVALDLDGTVLCPEGDSPVSARLKASIRELQARGIPVTFVTGRTESYARSLAEELSIGLPLVTYNGARVYSLSEERALFEASIVTEEAARIYSWLEPRRLVVACYLNRPGLSSIVQNRCSGSPAHDDHLFGTPRILNPNLLAEIRNSESASKLILCTREEMGEQLEAEFNGTIQAVRTHEELIEILPSGVTKGRGLLHLCEELRIDPDQVLAVGDQANDISTFGVCGHSVAMGHAPKAVKEAADLVTESFGEDGCAKALERVLAGKDKP